MYHWKYISVDGEVSIHISVSLLSDFVDFNTIKRGLIRNRKGIINTYQHACDPDDRRKKYVRCSTIPIASLQALNAAFPGGFFQAYCRERIEQLLPMQIESSDYDRLADTSLSVDKCRQIVKSCAFMRFLDKQYLRDKCNSKKKWLQQYVAILKEEQLYGLRVSNWRSLDRKHKRWQDEGIMALLPGHLGNENARRLPHTGENYLIVCYANPLKPAIEDVHRLYCVEAKKRGWPEITVQRVQQILKSPKNIHLWFAARHGKKAAQDKLERTIKRRKPSFPDALWSLDGTTVQLRWQEGGKVMKAIWAVSVMDVYSGKIVGLAVGDSETSILVQRALRAATRNTGYFPRQLQYDNSSAMKSKEVEDLMSRVAVTAFPTRPYNGKSKPIEAAFGRIESRVLRFYPNYKGGNITSPSLDNKANPDFLTQVTKDGLPDRKGVIEQLLKAIRIYNEIEDKKGETPNAKYQIDHKKRRKVTFLSVIDCFWVERRREVKYTKDGLTIEVNKERITYEVEKERGVEDMEFRNEWLGMRFTVKYDPEELEQIALFYENKFVAIATMKYEFPSYVGDFEEGEREMLNKALQARDQYDEENEEQLKIISEELSDEGFDELDMEILRKDELGRVEAHMVDEEIMMNARPLRSYQSRTLYEPKDEEDDGEIRIVEE